ncbi:poly-gamma-glutamate hydrolase family protein, partial [Priestia endophytica]|uniref:poly-gamma-glutamate hydrolase family protein n=1 Tax=Priestia endophytica TaxID=135735 RepID=UPI003D2A5090
MADVYANYEELAAAKVEGKDYQIRYKDNGSETLLFSPHAGGIEIGSTELITAISDDRPEWDWYLFEGMQSSNNTELHITSTNFDEPRALNMMSKASRSITIHGKAGTEPDTAIGGLDSPLRNTIWKNLEDRGFTVIRASGGIAGMEPDNLVNRNLRGLGVQLELSTAQRKAFFKDNDWSRSKREDPANWTEQLHSYKQAIIDAVEAVYGRSFDVSTTFLMNFEGDLEYGKGYQNEMATKLQSKVDQNIFDPVKGTVEQHTSDITQMAEELKTVVHQEVFDTVAEKVSTNESLIQQQAELIKSKVEQTDFDKLGEKVSDQESVIQQQANLIQSKVTEEQVKEIGRRQERLKVRYIRDTLNGSTKNSGNLWGEIQAYRKGENVALNKPVSSSAPPTGLYDLTVVTDDVTDKSVSIDGENQWVQVDLEQVYDDLEYLHIWHYEFDVGRAFNQKTQVSEDGVNWYTLFDSDKDGAIAEVSGGLKIIINNVMVLGEMQTSIEKHGSTISQLSDEITSKVEQEAFNELTGTVEEHSSTITQHAEDIQARVQKGDVVQQLNLDTSGLTIDVSKLDIKGVTNFIASGYPNMMPPKFDSFEQFNTGTLENWKEVGYSNNLDYCDVTTSYSLDGGKALRIRSKVADDGWVYLSNASDNYNIPVIEGKTYMFSFYAYNFNNTLAGVKGAVKDSAGNFYHTDQVEINKHNGWVRFSRKVTIPSGVTAVNTVLYNQKASISVVFDCVQFEEVEPDVLRPSSWKPVSATIINGANIETGTMSWDAGYGGNMTLGGQGNKNGRLVVLNDNNEVIADLDAAKGGFSDLYVSNLQAPNVVSYGNTEINLYVSDRKLEYNGSVDPSDNNDGDGWTRPLASFTEALRRIPKFFDGTATIHTAYKSHFYTDINVKSFIGDGKITIDGGSSTIDGNLNMGSNTINLEVKDLTINGRGSSYSIVSSYQNSSVTLRNLLVYGNGSERGIDVLKSGFTQVVECGVYDVGNAILARYGATTFVISCRGYGSAYGLYAYGGYIGGYGTAPNGSSAKGEESGGKIFASFTPDNGAYSPPAPPQTTKTFTSSSQDSWRDNFGGQWYGQGEAVQGYWGGYGIYRGLWFYGTSVSGAVTGKT